MTRKCQICHGLLDKEVNSTVSVIGPEDNLRMNVCGICAASVCEFILEFSDDVKTKFRDQDERWKLDREPWKQKKLEVFA